MSEINSEMYLVEGVVETDPLTSLCTVRTEREGQPFSFDPQDALRHFDGREIRIVIVPLATYQQIQQAVKQAEADGVEVEFPDLGEAGN